MSNLSTINFSLEDLRAYEGRKFGFYMILKYAGTINHNLSSIHRFLCRCTLCGVEKEIELGPLKSGATTCYGCARKRASIGTVKKRFTAHRQSGTPLYKTWISMKSRCTNPNEKSYVNYGGRGIKVCDAWINSFEAFMRDVGPRPTGDARYSLDRIDNNRGYYPGNVKWSTHKEQNRNKRTNRFLTLKGETLCYTDWASKLKVPFDTLRDRIARGWTEKEILQGHKDYAHKKGKVIPHEGSVCISRL